MSKISLVTHKTSFCCLRAPKDLTVLTRHLSKIYNPVKTCSSRKTQYSTSSNIGKGRVRHLYTSSQDWQKSHAKKRRYLLHDTEEEVRLLAHTHSDIGWGVRLSAENGYLSWMRNTYIMTLAGVAMLNSSIAPLSPVAGAGVFLVAGLNMLCGSLSFIYNLHKLKKEEHISGPGSLLCQLLTVVHLFLWCSILLVFLPDLDKVEDVLEEELKED